MQLLGAIQNRQYHTYLEAGLNGFLFPLKDYACDYTNYYTLEDILSFQQNYPSATCFVVLNKMMYQKDLKPLVEILKTLKEYQVDGILFYDTAIVYYNELYHLDLPLYLHQTHFACNHEMIDTYYNYGVHGAYLSNELRKEEICHIASNTKGKLLLLLEGYPVVAMSRRYLISNYQTMMSKKKTSHLTIKEPKSAQTFFLQEAKEGTTFRYGKRLNASSIYQEVEPLISFGVLEQADLSSLEFLEVIRAYCHFDKKKLDTLLGHNRGFYYRNMVYQVKRK